ncbi:hypothetical protein C8J57DRAFT_1234827 [Mycena rebaudengoi]|nr:hypothetical protein C8J57DRAFT_1234827 [Mycena rebaudengoi]
MYFALYAAVHELTRDVVLKYSRGWRCVAVEGGTYNENVPHMLMEMCLTESQGMATGVDKGVDMGICVPGNNSVNTVVATWSTLPKLCLLGGTLVDPGFAQGRPSIFQLWHVWLSDAAQAARGTGGTPFQTF